MSGAEKHSEKTLTAFSHERFLKAFEELCANKQQRVILQDIYERLNVRWGYQGIDAVSSFPQLYRNLDFNCFQKAAEFLYSSSNDLQEAIEEFWWLMGMGSHAEILQDPEHFHNLSAAMPERGLEACKALAEGIHERICESI